MKEKILYVVIACLLIIISSGVTYIVMDNNNSKEGKENKTPIKENSNIKDEIKLVDIKEEDNKIIENFKIILNSKENNLEVIFDYQKGDPWGYVSAKVSNNQFVSFAIPEGSNFNKEKIKDMFNENNFKIIKGEDNKNYLAIGSMANNAGYVYIYNDNLEVLNANTNDAYKINNGFVAFPFGNNPCGIEKDPIYENDFNLKNDYGLLKGLHLKIDNNKIYYLRVITDSDNKMDFNNYYLEEIVYTINNNQMTYKTLDKYKVLEFCNQGEW